MRYQGTRIITLLCAAGMCCGAFAQTSSSDQSTSSTPSSSATQSSSQYPSSTSPSSTAPSSTTSSSTSTSSMSTSSTLQSNPGQVLARLDTSRKGYLSQTDVASNSYLSSHFAQCDNNGDGKLTENELSTCIQGAPSGTTFE